MTTYEAAQTVVKGLEKRDSLAYVALAYAILGDEERAETFRAYSRKLYKNQAAVVQETH